MAVIDDVISLANAHRVSRVDGDNSLSLLSTEFVDKAAQLFGALKTSREQLAKSPSDPSVLADYQAKLGEYTLFRNAQTSTVKVYKDIGAAIIQNFR